jgi:hypothetical protein
METPNQHYADLQIMPTLVKKPLAWTLTVHPYGTSQVRSPAGKIIRSHSPPPRPG